MKKDIENKRKEFFAEIGKRIINRAKVFGIPYEDLEIPVSQQELLEGKFEFKVEHIKKISEKLHVNWIRLLSKDYKNPVYIGFCEKEDIKEDEE